MTPQQKLEQQNDMRSFRDQFIKNLAYELAALIGGAPISVSVYKELLEKRLPSALEIMYPITTINSETNPYETRTSNNNS